MNALNLPKLIWSGMRWGFFRGGWLPTYLLQHKPTELDRLMRNGPVDVIVLFADHFEPKRKDGEDAAIKSVRSWCEDYTKLAKKHRDSEGRNPRHTWFYRAEYQNLGCIQTLSDYAFQGLGEIEFHLHHGFDTHESFQQKLGSGLDWFNSVGAMLTHEENPRRRFAYVAGNWALDNGARDDSKSGCNTELMALKETGCYADYTFPALGSRAQPKKINSIYYAKDTPEPKSYDEGYDVQVGEAERGDLMIFQGPISIDWRQGRIEGGAIENYQPPHPSRLGLWLSAHVHVRRKPSWVFIKLHTHGMQSRKTLFNGSMDELLNVMVTEWTRAPFRLHFATAREAYNMVKAAESGHDGNPSDFRDFEIAPPANRRIRCSSPWRLETASDRLIRIRILAQGPVRLDLADTSRCTVEGEVRSVQAHLAADRVIQVRVDGPGPFKITSSTKTLSLDRPGVCSFQ